MNKIQLRTQVLTPPTHLIYLGPKEVFWSAGFTTLDPHPTLRRESEKVTRLKNQMSVEARVQKREIFDMMSHH